MSFLKKAIGSVVGGTVPGLMDLNILSGAKSVGGLLSPQQQMNEQSQQTTAVNTPWAPQQPYLTYGFEEAKNLYNNKPINYSFSPDTQYALGLQRERALNGSVLNQNAQSALNSTINGDYLYGGAGFNAALDAASRRILPQVNSTFAGANRSGSGLAATAQTQALADAFASQYGQERNNQMQAIGMAPEMAASDYADISALREVGGAYDTLNQQQSMEPWQRLQMYQSGIGGNYGGTSTSNTMSATPNYTNPMAGALGGAMAGSSIGGPWGAGIGGILGLLGSRR